MRTRSLPAVLLIVFTLLAAAALFAQSGKVTGRVLDSTGSVMPGVRIRLYQGEKVVREGTSTPNGEFEISAGPGDYKLEVNAPEFDTYTEMVKVTPDMGPLSITMLLAQITEHVEVTETRTEISIDPDSSLQATVLTKEVIDALPDDEDELTQYLTDIAGSRGGAGGTATFVIDGFTRRPHSAEGSDSGNPHQQQSVQLGVQRYRIRPHGNHHESRHGRHSREHVF